VMLWWAMGDKDVWLRTQRGESNSPVAHIIGRYWKAETPYCGVQGLPNIVSFRGLGSGLGNLAVAFWHAKTGWCDGNLKVTQVSWR
jgi:hypothetical protein